MYIRNKMVRPGSDTVELLTSIMMRYPEVGTINFEPTQRVLKFTFVLSKVISAQETDLFRDKLINSVEAYNYIEGKDPGLIEIKANACDNLTILEISRDVETLDCDEISLIMAILHRRFGSVLIAEENEGMLEEELLVQEDLIRQMLESLRRSEMEKKLVAFREEGRVLVFNK